MPQGLPPQIEQSLQNQTERFLKHGETFRFDRIRQLTYYSTFLFAPGLGGLIAAGDYELFAVPRGGTGQGYNAALGERETNLEGTGGRIPDEANHLVTAIGIDIRRAPFATTAAPGVYPTGTVFGFAAGQVDVNNVVHPQDVALISDGMLVAVKYLDDKASIGKVADFPFPGGAVGFTQAGRQTNDIAPVIGQAGTTIAAGNRALFPLARNACAPAMERRLNVPLFLPAKSQFSMILRVPRALTLRAAAVIPSATGENTDATGALEVQIALQVIESFMARG